MKSIPVIIDSDPGHDDAIAIILALASEKLDVKGITVVAGNQTLEKTVQNTLKVLEYLGRDISVAAGAAKPIKGDLTVAANVHGESGLDGVDLPKPQKKVEKENAVEFIEKVVTSSEDKVSIIATGPLTNVATFLLCNPELKSKLKRICLMGGAAISGNRTPVAEFNIWQDPEAAHIVFNSGLPITMCGLDVTHKALLFEEDLAKIKNINNRISKLVIGFLNFYSKFYRKRGFAGIPIHDAVAVAWMLNSDIFDYAKYNVIIDLDGEHTRGCTVTDLIDVTNNQKNVDVVLDIDRERFIEMLISAIKVYD